MREVVLICGPPGAGKSTRARELAAAEGLRVFDLDDSVWGGSERAFRAALERVGRDPLARAVVIRAGATRSARLRAAVLVCATRVEVLAVPVAECERRVVGRRRMRPPLGTQLAAIRSWWGRFEPGEVVVPDGVPRTSRRW